MVIKSIRIVITQNCYIWLKGFDVETLNSDSNKW